LRAAQSKQFTLVYGAVWPGAEEGFAKPFDVRVPPLLVAARSGQLLSPDIRNSNLPRRAFIPMVAMLSRMEFAACTETTEHVAIERALEPESTSQPRR
jgi:hypothetical protein